MSDSGSPNPQSWVPKPPASVAAQAAEAERLLREQNGSAPPSQDGPPPPSPDPGPQGTAGQPPVPAPMQQPAADESTWEQRARSAHGRWEAAQQIVQAQAERLEAMERQLNEMQARGVAAPPPSQATLERLVTDQEVADYGPDLMDVVGRRAREVYAPEFETLARRLDHLEGRVEGTVQVITRNETENVFDTLAEAIPDWVQINHHPAFHSWLAQPARYTSRPKKDLLLEAFDRHDGPTVLNFFQDFLSEATGQPASPQPQPAPSPAPNGNGNGGRPSLADFAAPGRARSEPQQLPPDKPIYTRQIMQAFWDAVRRGAYKGREAEQAAIEADIFRAQHEGRIQ